MAHTPITRGREEDYLDSSGQEMAHTLKNAGMSCVIPNALRIYPRSAGVSVVTMN